MKFSWRVFVRITSECSGKPFQSCNAWIVENLGGNQFNAKKWKVCLAEERRSKSRLLTSKRNSTFKYRRDNGSFSIENNGHKYLEDLFSRILSNFSWEWSLDSYMLIFLKAKNKANIIFRTTEVMSDLIINSLRSPNYATFKKFRAAAVPNLFWCIVWVCIWNPLHTCLQCWLLNSSVGNWTSISHLSPKHRQMIMQRIAYKLPTYLR